jgi:hypothetical protein
MPLGLNIFKFFIPDKAIFVSYPSVWFCVVEKAQNRILKFEFPILFLCARQQKYENPFFCQFRIDLNQFFLCVCVYVE